MLGRERRRLDNGAAGYLSRCQWRNGG
jgi:hypothetical protein